MFFLARNKGNENIIIVEKLKKKQWFSHIQIHTSQTAIGIYCLDVCGWPIKIKRGGIYRWSTYILTNKSEIFEKFTLHSTM